ncbi:DUF1232 domain-containing protein [Tardiphaga sp.]|uniref:YkvA family protein n=1 Tax=Tardiphaga sp. TaxID=1926292 RepID=UPI0026159211|nr:DUF1232 domain-containing protein [Tardiphaga sp.]MDB5617938.1 hypothetical protein [Tardiphaga sp.]
MTILARVRQWASTIVRDVAALWLAARDPRVPWYAKAVAACVAAYALSPIDLIPDFIPVIGYLDDLLLVPLGILLAVRLVPPELMAEFRATVRGRPPVSRTGAVIIVLLWIAGAAFAGWIVWSALSR